jgi:hypothetical protein
MRKGSISPWLGLVVVVAVLVVGLPFVSLMATGTPDQAALPASASGPQLTYDVEPTGLVPTVTEWHFWAIFGLVLLGGYILRSGDRDDP